MADGNPLGETTWDAVIVGTGVAGATIGFELARQGWRVLFCEQGLARAHGRGDGNYAEMLDPAAASGDASAQRTAALLGAGRWAEPVDDLTEPGRSTSFTPFVGCGPGGSSALYGMAMERFLPQDFRPQDLAGAAAGRAALRRWPIDYDELAPHYTQAEALYRVRGTRDPLRVDDSPALLPAPPLSDGARTVAARLAALGLHPYQLPSACEYVPGCDACQGYLCAKDCKNDSGRVALKPALALHGARLIDDCKAVRLVQAARQVTAIECVHQGRPLRLHGKVVILAAGALRTPELLLRSASPQSPQGVSNGSGMVGRHLMRHLIDLYAVDLGAGTGTMDNRRKELAFNDFYAGGDGVKLGTVQSFGRLPPPQVVVQAMRQDLARSRHRWALPLFATVAPVLHAYLSRMIEHRLTLATIVEDFPDPDNRVELQAGRASGIAIRYRTDADGVRRVDQMRALMRKTLKPWRYRLIGERDNNQRIAHACGTCRFGDDPRTSVVNRNCRSHEIDNLYVVDSSVFPSSGGTNPSLTIAANALRVAAALTAGR